MSLSRILGCSVLSAAAFFSGLMRSENAIGQNTDGFFKSHRLTIGVASDPGGSFDIYARVLARHIVRHIPELSTIIVQDVPAAGGMQLANTVFNTVAKDGSYIGLIRGTTLNEEVYKNPAAHFEGSRFAWIGTMASAVDTCVASSASGIQSVDDFFKREVILGATGAGAASYSYPLVYNSILGTKFKVIPGYPGIPERLVAMERHELDGSCGITTTSIRSVAAQAISDGKVLLIAQGGGRKDPKYPAVVNMLDLAKKMDDRKALQFLFTPLDLDRPIVAPPETPPERLKILRQAFDETMRDPEFLADAKSLAIDIGPMDAATTAAIAGNLFGASKAIIDRVSGAVAHP